MKSFIQGWFYTLSAFKTFAINSSVSTNWFWVSEILRVLEFRNVKWRLISSWWESFFTCFKSLFRDDSFDNSILLCLFHWMLRTWWLKWWFEFWIWADYWLIDESMSLVSWNCRFMKIKDRTRSSSCCLKHLFNRFVWYLRVLISRRPSAAEIFRKRFFLNWHCFINLRSFFNLFLLKFIS